MEVGSARSNINTVLLTVALAVMGWVGHTTQGTAVDVARLSEGMQMVKQQNEISVHDRSDLRIRLEGLEVEVAKLKQQVDLLYPRK